MKKSVLGFLKIILVVYIVFIVVLYFIQERLIFFPEKLDKAYKFDFGQDFEELSFKMEDGILLNGLLFKADTPKGLIFYLHGNAGSLKSWGAVAKVYTDLHYDLFMLDYRGYGKSEGRIGSESQLHKDVQTVYNKLKARYSERDMIILGYSIGTGPATKLASTSGAKMLILQAPYYNLVGIMRGYYPIIPTFILKYRLETNRYIRACKMPIVIFHGDSDEVIDYRFSLKLKELLKPSDTLITLKGQGHNGMSDHPEYLHAITEILGR